MGRISKISSMTDWILASRKASACDFDYRALSFANLRVAHTHTHGWKPNMLGSFDWIWKGYLKFSSEIRSVVFSWLCFECFSSCYLPGEYNLCISTYRFHRQLAQYPFSACEIPQWQSLIDITSPNSNTKHTKPNKPHATQPVWSPHVCDYTHITSESHDHTREVSNRNLHIVCSEVVRMSR